MSYPATPTLDKIKAVQAQSQAIGEFLEWLGERKVALYEWREDVTDLREVWPVHPQRKHPLTDFERFIGGPDPMYGLRGEQSPPPAYESVPLSPRYVPTAKKLEDWLHSYFEIDAAAAEAERRAILEHIRSAPQLEGNHANL